MPVTLMLLFGYGVNLDLKGLPVYVYDQDGSQQSQDLLKHFQSSEYFHIVRVVDNYAALTRALDDGSAKMAIVIPWNFSQRLSEGGPVEVQALVDAPTTTRPTCSSATRRPSCRATPREIQIRLATPARPIADSARANQRRNPHLVQRRS
jgi:ABC-2 type transport system permease protein